MEYLRIATPRIAARGHNTLLHADESCPVEVQRNFSNVPFYPPWSNSRTMSNTGTGAVRRAPAVAGNSVWVADTSHILQLYPTVQGARRVSDRDNACRNGFHDHRSRPDSAAFPYVSHENGTIADPAFVPNCDLGILGLG